MDFQDALTSWMVVQHERSVKTRAALLGLGPSRQLHAQAARGRSNGRYDSSMDRPRWPLAQARAGLPALPEGVTACVASSTARTFSAGPIDPYFPARLDVRVSIGQCCRQAPWLPALVLTSAFKYDLMDIVRRGFPALGL